MSKNSNKDDFLKEYNDLIQDLTEQIHKTRPKDTVRFCFDFFQSHLPQEEYRAVHPNEDEVQASIIPLEPILEEEQDELHSLPQFKAHLQTRRVSVSAESIEPKRRKPSYQKMAKPQEEREMILCALKDHFLFNSIEQPQQIIEIMQPREFKRGDCVIEQGAAGDYFYVVSSGTLDCLVDGTRVTRYERGGSFGELALMYNAPRAATLIATSDTTLWALDRLSFRSLVMESNATQRSLHESFLRDVPLLKSLETPEIHKIADVLETVWFEHQQVVLRQGEPGNNFYMIEQGKALFYKEQDGKMEKVNELNKGDYFGELALLNDKPRAVTVMAEGPLKCVTLSKLAFIRLLGPVMDILKRNTANYHAVLKDAQL